jgi:hypothetical protein
MVERRKEKGLNPYSVFLTTVFRKTMKKIYLLTIIPILGLTLSCGKKFTPTQKTDTNSAFLTDYDEDLSAVRPKYEPKPVATVIPKKVETPNRSQANSTLLPMNVNTRVDAVLDTMANRNKNIRYIQGYRIQLYVGNNRKEADEAKAFMYSRFPELNAYMTFTQPTFRLKVGDFMSKMDAERYHTQMKETYSASMIVPDRIDIRKSLLTK